MKKIAKNQRSTDESLRKVVDLQKELWALGYTLLIDKLFKNITIEHAVQAWCLFRWLFRLLNTGNLWKQRTRSDE